MDDTQQQVNGETLTNPLQHLYHANDEYQHTVFIYLSVHVQEAMRFSHSITSILRYYN